MINSIFNKSIKTIDTHTAGEATRIVISGISKIQGKTITEKKIWLEKNRDDIRKMLMQEPRGHKDMFGAILIESSTPNTDIGVIFMDTKGYLSMCGHGIIGVTTAIINTGIIASKKKYGTQKVIIDTPAGIITSKAMINNNKVQSVTFRNVPSFLHSTILLNLPGVGEISVNIAYGGNYFALVKANDLNISIKPQNIMYIKKIGIDIRNLVNNEHTIIHPGSSIPAKVDLVEIYDDSISPPVNVVIFGNGQIDRSPCGTGTCAKMAMLYENGRLPLNKTYKYRSILGTTFYGKLIRNEQVGTKSTVVPEITGKAFITGFHEFVVDEADPFPHGFSMDNLE